MNPARRSKFTVEKLQTDNKFVTVNDLKSHALEAFQFPQKLKHLVSLNQVMVCVANNAGLRKMMI